MKEEIFNDIVTSIRSFKGLSRDCAYMLIKKYPSVAVTTLHSILTEAVINHVKGSRKKLYSNMYKKEYWDEYRKAVRSNMPPGIIVRIAESKNLPPSSVGRAILETYCKDLKSKDATLRQYLRDPTLIEDSNLAYEIYLCVLHDDRYGYIADTFSTSIGYEYEVKLKYCLIKHNIAFIDEDKLRERGYDKTPDFKLEVPIAVDGFVINWIESKARFGSEEVHDTTVKEQYLSYWNRFGPGLVIYWFDFVETLLRPNEKKFIIMNHFPENITHLDTKLLQSAES